MQKRAGRVGERATWAAVLGLLGAAAASGCAFDCTEQPVHPEGDPCFGKDGCETVDVALDGGSDDVDAGTTTVFCGCCNG